MNEPHRSAVLCPKCRRLVSVDERKCPHCGHSRPGARWKQSPLGQILFGQGQLISWLIYLNAGLYLISLLFNPRGMGVNMNPLTFLSPDNQSLLLLGASGTLPIDQLGRWWTLLSANYLHGGLMHLFFNMMAVGQIAPLILRFYGQNRTIIIYTWGGIIGFYISYLAGVPFTIGASAALCALLGAAIYYGKSRGGIYGQAVYRQIGGWAIAILAFGLIVPGINNWGHGGGFVAGAGLGWALGYIENRTEKPFYGFLATGSILLTGVVLAWAVGSSFYYRFLG